MAELPVLKNVRHDLIRTAFPLMGKPDIHEGNVADARNPVSIHNDLPRYADAMTTPNREIALFELFLIGIHRIIGDVFHGLHEFFFVYQEAFRLLLGKFPVFCHKIFSGPVADQKRFLRPQPDLLHFFIIHRQPG